MVSSNLYTSKNVVVDSLKIYTVALTVAVSSNLNSNSWSTISSISSQGLASRYWSVGDTKTIILNGSFYFNSDSNANLCKFDNYSIDAFIIGINHNSSREGTGVHFQIGKVDGKLVTIRDQYYNQTASSNRGMTIGSTTWKDSGMRTVTIPKFVNNILPASLIFYTRYCTKYTNNAGAGSNYNSSSDISSTQEKFF